MPADDISADNLRAAGAIYTAAQLDELRLFAVTDRIAELFAAGQLPIGSGRAAKAFQDYWRARDGRLSEAERRAVYARVLGLPGGDSTARANRQFDALWLRFVTAANDYARPADAESSLDQGILSGAARDLAANLSRHAGGMALRAAVELGAQMKDATRLLGDPDVRRAFGARDMWQVVDSVARNDLGGARNSARHRALAQSGTAILDWLAEHARDLAKARAVRPVIRKRRSKLLASVAAWLAASATTDA